MPILVGTTAPPPVTPVAPSLATDLFWTSAPTPEFPTGRRTQLTNWQSYTRGIVVRPGVMGLLMPTWDFFADRSPAIDGETIRGVRAAPREISIPLYLWGADRDECLTIFRDLISDLNPQDGEGILEIREPAGQTRTIGAYYAGGFEGSDDDDAQGRTWMSAILTFRAPRPFWEGEQWSRSWGIGGTVGDFFPLLPLTVRNSQVIGALTVPNVGNVRAFPIWELTGPFNSFTASNGRTGKAFTYNYALAAGKKLLIDTREGVKAVIEEPAGTPINQWQRMTAGASLWPLERGDNSVTFSAPGATAQSQVKLTYRPRYLAAY